MLAEWPSVGMPACPSTSDRDSTNKPVMRMRARKARSFGKAKKAAAPSVIRTISGRKGIADRRRRVAAVACSRLTVATSHAPSEQTLRTQGQHQEHRDVERD